VSSQPPAPFYYLEHFSAVLQLLRERDCDLLTPAESEFVRQFFASAGPGADRPDGRPQQSALL
jgi:hypothetical protein